MNTVHHTHVTISWISPHDMINRRDVGFLGQFLKMCFVLHKMANYAYAK